MHDWSHGVDLTMCKKISALAYSKDQSNIASKPGTGTSSYTLTKNKLSTALKAVELGSLVFVRVVSSLWITGHALLAILNFQKQ